MMVTVMYFILYCLSRGLDK